MAQRGIQSVEVGGRLLLALADQGTPMALKDLASAAGMAAAKAHPYLVSFGKLGLVVQDAASARYGLGPLAMQLGLISLQQSSPLTLATARLPELAATIGHTVAIAVWGNRGATIVRIEEAPSPVHVAMRHGTVLTLRGTASGLVFAAHLPRAAVTAADPDLVVDAAFERQLARVRRAGYAHAIDAAVRGISAVAAPVFDADGTIALGLTAIGATPDFDGSERGLPAVALRRTAAELSARLGAGTPETSARNTTRGVTP